MPSVTFWQINWLYWPT